MRGFIQATHNVMVTVAVAIKGYLPMKNQSNDYASKGLALVTRLSDDDKVGNFHKASTTILLVCAQTAPESTRLTAAKTIAR